MKNGKVKEIDKKLSPSGNKVKECIIDDVEGFMNAGKGANEKRTSCIKFSWAIATEENEYQTMLHTRIDVTQGNSKKKEEKETTEGDGNTNKDQNTQMLFHRPLRNNEYALTVQVDLDRIGFDDEKLIYALDEADIKSRQEKCIKALLNMFVDMEGAMCSTRLPHIQNIEGILVKKTDKNQVLSKYSALEDDYKEVNQKISDDAIIFNDIVEFTETMKELI
jgi:CRISPR-associated protein Cst2